MTKVKYILIIILCLFAVSLQAGQQQGAGEPQTAATPCTTSQQKEDGASAGSYDIAKTANPDELYWGTKFTYVGTNGKAICQANLWVEKVGSPTRDYYVAIYSDNGGEPTTVLGTSDAVASSSVAAAETETAFVFSTPTSALTNGASYWVVLYSGSEHADNYLRWHIANAIESTPIERMEKDDDGAAGAWTYVTASYTGKYELFSQ